MLSPVIILVIGMPVVVGAIALLRLNAFLALIGAAVIVGTTAMATTVILTLLVPLR